MKASEKTLKIHLVGKNEFYRKVKPGTGFKCLALTIEKVSDFIGRLSHEIIYFEISGIYFAYLRPYPNFVILPEYVDELNFRNIFQNEVIMEVSDWKVEFVNKSTQGIINNWFYRGQGGFYLTYYPGYQTSGTYQIRNSISGESYDVIIKELGGMLALYYTGREKMDKSTKKFYDDFLYSIIILDWGMSNYKH